MIAVNSPGMNDPDIPFKIVVVLDVNGFFFVLGWSNHSNVEFIKDIQLKGTVHSKSIYSIVIAFVYSILLLL